MTDLRAKVEAWIPQHSSACAAQDDDADCICGTSAVYEAALSIPKDAVMVKEETLAAYFREYNGGKRAYWVFPFDEAGSRRVAAAIIAKLREAE